MYYMTFDYHTHTIFSHGIGPVKHGKGTIEENVKAAYERGLSAVAISDHGPGHLSYGVHPGDVEMQREEIESLKSIFPGMEIYLSVEANISDTSLGIDLLPIQVKKYDFVIAGYHYAVKNGYCPENYLCEHGMASKKAYERQREKNTAMTVRAIEKNDIKILTHPGDKGPLDIYEVALACEKKGVWMEISAHHPHLTVEEITEAAATDVSFVVSSDAHEPKYVGTFGDAVERAIEAGVDISRIVNIEEKP